MKRLGERLSVSDVGSPGLHFQTGTSVFKHILFNSLGWAASGLSSAAAALPPNLTLADPDLLTRPERPSLQQTRLDETSSPRNSPRAVFQRPGAMGRPVELPVHAFAVAPGADSDAPPPPPETIQLNAKVFGQPLRLDILQTVRAYF